MSIHRQAATRPTAIVNTNSKNQLALVALALSLLLASLGSSSANVVLPTLSDAFSAPFRSVQWVVLAYLLASTSLMVTAGRLGDILGRRTLLLTGIALFSAGALAGALAPGLWWLVGARALQGVGAAIMLSLSLSMVGAMSPAERTGRAMGLLGSTSAIGTALGPTAGGLVIDLAGWRGIFWITALLSTLVFVLANAALPPDHKRSRVRGSLDLGGTLLLAITLSAYALAMTPAREGFGLRNALILIGALLSLFAFITHQRHRERPLIRLDELRKPDLRVGLSGALIVSTVVMATLVIGPFYLAHAIGLSAARVGLVMSIGPVTVALTGIPSGRLADRYGPAIMNIVGLSIMLAGCGLLAILPAVARLSGYVAAVIVVTIGYALFQTANNTSVMKGLPDHQRGVVSGLLNLSRNLGLITGSAVMGAIFAAAIGDGGLNAASESQITSAMRIVFSAAAALVLTALALQWKVKRSMTG